MEEIIDRSVYLTLSPEEQKKYVLITPTAKDKELAASIDLIANEQKILEKLEPIQSKAVMIPNPLPGEQIDSCLDRIERMVKLIDPIVALTKVPIIGQLAAPVVNIINAIFGVIGMLFMMIMMSARGTELFTDSICKAVDEMDWDSLKESVDEMKKKRQEMKKKAQESGTSEVTEVAGEVTRKTVDAGSKALDYVGNEIKGEIDAVKQSADIMYDSVIAVDAGARAVKIAKETQLQNYSWESMGNKIIQTGSLLGVDFSPLNSPTQQQMAVFEKSFPNPSAEVFKANKAINKLTGNKKYARIQEKKVVVDTEKKIITTPKIKLSDKLSPHFTLAQMCYSDTAKKLGIDNTPPAYVVENLKLLCENILEKVYDKFGNAGQFRVNSAYRSPRVNRYVGGKTTSQHTTGQAADIEIIGVSNYKVATWIKENLQYDQLILEECKNPNNINDGWIHVSFDPSRLRKNDFTIAYSSRLPGLVPPPYNRRLA